MRRGMGERGIARRCTACEDRLLSALPTLTLYVIGLTCEGAFEEVDGERVGVGVERFE